MPPQDITWALTAALIAAHQLKRQLSNNDDEGAKWALGDVYACAGCFKSAPVNPANDLNAALFISVVLLNWSCAKYCANLLVLTLVLRKINEAKFFPRPPQSPVK